MHLTLSSIRLYLTQSLFLVSLVHMEHVESNAKKPIWCPVRQSECGLCASSSPTPRRGAIMVPVSVP